MAYAAVTSLYHTIDLLLNSSRTSIYSSSQKILKYARWVAARLQVTLRNYDKIKNSNDEVLALDARIRDEARKLEETIESQASSQFLSQSQSQSHGRSFSLDLSHLSHHVSRFLHTAEVMGKEYMKELYKPEKEAAEQSESSEREEMVGSPDLFVQVRDLIAGDDSFETDSVKAIAITGMAGIGKTAFVKNLFYDSLVKERFEHRAFVRVGQRYDFEQILIPIMSQLYGVESRKMSMTANESISQFFTRSIRGREFLIVLDDVTSMGYIEKLLDLIPKHCVANVLLTSRIDGIGHNCSHRYYIEKLYRPEDEAAAAAVPHSITSEPDGNNMVGLDDLFLEIRDRIAQVHGHPSCIAITGMAGIGKTTFVKKLFHDALIMKEFKHRALVRVGQKCELEQILRSVIAQLNVDGQKFIMGGNERLTVFFKRYLMGRKFLIVLDDVWDNVSPLKLLDLLPRESHDACVLLTSRIDGIRDDYCLTYRMRFLNEVESWGLLQRTVFGEDEDVDDYSCPHQLVKAGKKIAENCEGLPLLILSVAYLLIKAPKEVNYWEEVAKMKNSVFEDACDLIHDQLLTSYHFLAQKSKACFLYMCVFPKDYIVWRSKVNNLWLAEGFSDGVSFILDDIVSSILVVTRHQNWSRTRAKTFNLHIVNRHLSRKVAEDNKFVFVLNTYEAGGPSEERIRDKPHLAIHNNSLLAMKEVHDSIARVSTLPSMLCTGPYHQYQVPVCMELKLLRVLDAVTIRFYEFPVEVVKLIQLRYLSLSTNANLPPSINKLWFIEYLIVHQHLSIINRRRTRYVPVEIWELEQLKYLQLVGRNLPVPPPGGILSNLTTLLDVGAKSCAVGVLESIPKLEKLRIRIESAPDLAPTIIRFDDFCLERLKSLASVVVNPKLTARPPRLRISTFMSNLRKLSLRGFGYPWEDMYMIAALSNLQVLKLQCYAFRGERWLTSSELRFEELRYLLIEDTDLVQWICADGTFPKLTHLTMRNCHKLHLFPLIKTLSNIQLVDCNPLAEARARTIVNCDVRVECSWK